MKKLLKITAAMLMTCAVLTGCTSNSTDDNDAQPVAAWEEQLGKQGVIAIGISPDYPPYESLDANGNMEGFDIDMVAELQKYFGTEDAPYEIEWVQMSFDTIISSVQTGQVDIGVAGFTYDPDRDVLFSEPYMESGQVALVNPDSSIKTVEDLKNKKIGAQLGATAEKAANSIEGADVQAVSSVNVLIESLKSNALDAVIVDIPVAKGYVENAGFVMLDEVLIDESTSIIAAKGNDELIAKVNEAIIAFKASDAYNELKEKWGMN